MRRLVNTIAGRFGFEIRRKRRRNPGFDAAVTGTLEQFVEMTEGMITTGEAAYLYALARGVQAHPIVEIGSYRGRSTVALGRGSLDGGRVPVYAIEPHEEFTGLLGGKFGPSDRGAFFRAMLDTGCYQVVRLINLSSEVVAPGWDRPVALLWIDGDHSYEGVRRDVEAWRPHLVEGALLALHDSLDPDLGPARVIAELLGSGDFERVDQVEKIAVLRRVNGGRREGDGGQRWTRPRGT